MKNPIYALTVLLLFTAAACGGGKRSKPAAASVQTEILGIDIKLTKDFEQYDAELLNRLKLWANDTWTDDRGWQILPDGTLIEINRSWGSPDLYILPKGSHFGLLRRYHDNGNIHEKGWLLRSSHMRVGVWYEFDMDGNLIAETDHDAPFTFTWEDVVAYCRKNKIRIVNVPPNETEPTTIRREVEDGQYRWIIACWTKSRGAEIIWLDGKTGEELCREKIYNP